MSDVLSMAWAVMMGVILGMIFFGGLWWTVEKGVAAKRPELLFLGSLLLRVSVTLAGFYYVGNGKWQRIIGCLIGFILARAMVNWLTQSSRAKSNGLQEDRHEA
jgi:F1F0 ATPase subunit 2